MFDFCLNNQELVIRVFAICIFLLLYFQHKEWSREYDLEQEALKSLMEYTNNKKILQEKKRACNLFLGSYKKAKK